MARPSKTRFICKMPAHCRFTTEGNPKNGINLTIEEYETIRLMDYLGMTQAECAKQMNVSRATVQAVRVPQLPVSKNRRRIKRKAKEIKQ